MTRTQATIARNLRRSIGKHYQLIGNSNLTQTDFLIARAESDKATSSARYLAQHLVALDSDAFLLACGLRSI